MERLEDYLSVDSIGSATLAVEEPGEIAEGEFPEHETPQESISTDDPVRVYLREMGAVRLLSRQGEIILARRMERGKALMHKGISRFPLVWQRTLDLADAMRRDKAIIDEYIEFPSVDDDDRAEVRVEVGKKLAKFARLYGRLRELEEKLASTLLLGYNPPYLASIL